MRLFYPDADCPDEPTVRYTETTVRGKRCIRVTLAQFDSAHPLVYAALGAVDGTRFLPAYADCTPKLPLTWPLDGIDTPALQFSDTLGRQAFWRL